jgi:hypothetical protein
MVYKPSLDHSPNFLLIKSSTNIMMHREYENDNLAHQVFIQRARDDFHKEYKIRRPSQNIPDYDLPVIQSSEGVPKEQSRFTQLTPEGVNPYAICAQYENLIYRGKSQHVAPTNTEDADIFELPGPATRHSISSAAARTSSTTASSREVYNADEADIAETIARTKKSLAQAYERLAKKQAGVALEQQCIRQMDDHLTTLAQIQQHAQGGNNNNGKGAGASQNKQDEPQEEDGKFCKHQAYMHEYFPPPRLNTPDPNRPVDARYCLVGRPDSEGIALWA